MIPLESPRWRELTQTYGHAAAVPEVLRRLAAAGSAEDEPWPELWGMLCHDADPGSAAFAAVPHLFAILAADPSRVHAQFFALPAAIEAARDADDLELPDDVAEAYRDAWRGAATLVAACIDEPWDAELALAAVAVLGFAKDVPDLGLFAAGVTPDELAALTRELTGGGLDD